MKSELSGPARSPCLLAGRQLRLKGMGLSEEGKGTRFGPQKRLTSLLWHRTTSIHLLSVRSRSDELRSVVQSRLNVHNRVWGSGHFGQLRSLVAGATLWSRRSRHCIVLLFRHGRRPMFRQPPVRTKDSRLFGLVPSSETSHATVSNRNNF
jgi:hypothetical protein